MAATRSNFVAAILVVASVSSVAAWFWRPKPGEPSAAREARAAIAAGRYDDASAALERWRKAAPDDPTADYVRGRILIEHGSVVEASEALKKAAAAGLPERETSLLRALIAARINRYSEALPALFDAFVYGRTPDRQVYKALAKVYLETYELGRASTVLARWAEDFPDDPKPHLWRAEIHARDGGDPGAVVFDYQDALDRDPNLFPARLGLADALRQLHRTQEAAAAYDVCLKADPDNAAAHFGMGRNLLEQGEEEAAVRHLARASELDPANPDPLKNLAEAAVRRADWPAALEFLDRATALDPNDAAVRYRRGVILAKLERADESRAELAEAARLRADVARLNSARSHLVGNPNDRNTQLVIARWMFEHGRAEEGVRWAVRILADQPGDPEASRLLVDYHEGRGETGLANFHRLHASPKARP